MKTALYIYVPAYLYEFITSEYNSPDGIIEIGKNDIFFEEIKYLLQLEPIYKKPVDRQKNPMRLTLLLPQFKIGNEKYVDTRYRRYVNPTLQNILRLRLMKLFKLRAHSFILSACRCGAKQSDAIRDFFHIYNIDENNLKFDMLKKSWDRSKEKSMLMLNTVNYA